MGSYSMGSTCTYPGDMQIALAGVGRMGSAIAERLRAAGHRLYLYDPVLPPGGEVRESLAAAARGAEIVLLSLPDAAAVEASLAGLAEARPPLVVDLTSSLPETTRRVATELAPLGVAFVDAPVSGGVAGARAGTLTAMVGGDPELLERVRPVLSSFASTIRWAGPLGAGHATKALNNALSAVSLTGTAELLVTATGYGVSEAEAVRAVNDGPARSQNSEVKYPRDVLPRSYAAGFSAGLMEKDVATALAIGAAHAVPTPFLSGAFAVWREATQVMGAGADFTRVHAVIAARSVSQPDSREGFSLDVLCRALAALNLIAVREVLSIAEAEGLERTRFLEIVNASTGRSEATRSAGAGEVDSVALAQARDLAARAGVWAPLTELGALLSAGSADLVEEGSRS
jgi:3-hydroxyisobutyrate dehydrogenase